MREARLELIETVSRSSRSTMRREMDIHKANIEFKRREAEILREKSYLKQAELDRALELMKMENQVVKAEDSFSALG